MQPRRHLSLHRAPRRHERNLVPEAASDFPRIPHLPPAADGMLGLLARHTERQLPLLNQHELHRRRQQLFHNPRRNIILEASVHLVTMLPQIEAVASELPRTSNAGSCKDERAPYTSLLVDRPNKVESPHLIDNFRSVWEESHLDERLNPSASPRHTVTSTCRLVSTAHATPLWRIKIACSPDSRVNAQSNTSRKRRAPPSPPRQIQSDVAARATKRPRLVCQVPSQWHQKVSLRDRAKTRERAIRSLHLHCQGDYELLVLVLSAMEEELLHIKTTSIDSYEQQAFGLSDLIKHATLER